MFTVQKALLKPGPHYMLSLVCTCQSKAGTLHSPAQQQGFGETSAMDAMYLEEESLGWINTVCSQIGMYHQKQTVAHIRSTHQSAMHVLGLKMGPGECDPISEREAWSKLSESIKLPVKLPSPLTLVSALHCREHIQKHVSRRGEELCIPFQ